VLKVKAAIAKPKSPKLTLPEAKNQAGKLKVAKSPSVNRFSKLRTSIGVAEMALARVSSAQA
jgi:hypothetical protein